MYSNPQLNRQLCTELMAYMQRTQPTSLLYCCSTVVPTLADLVGSMQQVQHVQNLDGLEGLPRFELGVVFDFLEDYAPQQGIQFLGKLRNLHCERLWLVVADDANWDFNTLISLGFTRQGELRMDQDKLNVYVYDLASYNRKREWNNPKHWANPENWGKYRW